MSSRRRLNRPLSELGDGVLAVGLDDVVGKAVIHQNALEMLCLMLCYAFLCRDDRTAEAGDGLNHGEDGDVLLLFVQLVSGQLLMRVVREAVVQLNRAVLMLMSTMLSAAPLSFRSEEVFASQERVSGFPEKGADLRGSPGNLRGSSGNFRGSLGNFRGTPGLLLSSTVRELLGKSQKNFRGSLGNFRGSPGTFQKLGVA